MFDLMFHVNIVSNVLLVGDSHLLGLDFPT